MKQDLTGLLTQVFLGKCGCEGGNKTQWRRNKIKGVPCKNTDNRLPLYGLYLCPASKTFPISHPPSRGSVRYIRVLQETHLLSKCCGRTLWRTFIHQHFSLLLLYVYVRITHPTQFVKYIILKNFVRPRYIVLFKFNYCKNGIFINSWVIVLKFLFCQKQKPPAHKRKIKGILPRNNKSICNQQRAPSDTQLVNCSIGQAKREGRRAVFAKVSRGLEIEAEWEFPWGPFRDIWSTQLPARHNKHVERFCQTTHTHTAPIYTEAHPYRRAYVWQQIYTHARARTYFIRKSAPGPFAWLTPGFSRIIFTQHICAKVYCILLVTTPLCVCYVYTPNYTENAT